MNWHSWGRKNDRRITAIYVQSNRGYVVGMRSDDRNNLTVEWLDMVDSDQANGAVYDRLVGRLLATGHSGEERVLCVDEAHMEELIREYPPLSNRELKAAVATEVECQWGDSCLWAYQQQGTVVKIKTLAKERLTDLLEPFDDGVSFASIMGMMDPVDGGEISVDWGELTPTDPLERMVATAGAYAKNCGYAFIRLPAVLVRWHWLRIGVIFLLINLLVSLGIGLTGYYHHQKLQSQQAEYRHQAQLLADVAQLQAETGRMLRVIKDQNSRLAELSPKGLGISGYGIMVELASHSVAGVVLTKAEVTSKAGLVIQGRAETMDALLKYAQATNSVVESTKQDENGDVQFICRGQL
ncbi:MAG: hypothetical protein E7197_05970 [Anaerovibrio sp.]|uniref:hypothetical protein n=1 Tax=Anaerovibrio sp. TaxID=1872532 RepID=UPI0025C426C9|nr:hypothetical protein [Anaerovibrio sp.]MBE6099586.1 hypothetical protein [Anaerovibrio sp.]